MSAVHDREVRLRLNDADYALLKALAVRAGMPIAVLARTWVKARLQSHGLRPQGDSRRHTGGRSAQSLRPCQMS